MMNKIENKTWVTGEVITADDLNKITPLIVHETTEEIEVDGFSTTKHTLDKTWQEIYDHISNAILVLLSEGFDTFDNEITEVDVFSCIKMYYGEASYGVMFGDFRYMTDSASSYPYFIEAGSY